MSIHIYRRMILLEEIRARSNVARAVERLENELTKMIGVKDYSASQLKEGMLLAAG